MKIVSALLVLSGIAVAETPKDPDEAVLQSPTCAGFMASLKKHMAGAAPPAAGTSPEQALLAVFAKVKLEVPAAEFATCSAAMQHGLETYRTKSILVEANVTLRSIGNGLASHYIDENKLCPSSKKLAPPKLETVAKEPHVATTDDWSDPAWKCVGIDASTIGKQRFQYELKVTGNHVDVIARGYPTPGKLTTVTRSGNAANGTITWTDPVTK